MAQHDASHAPKERTILWIIVPATIFISLMFTKLNHGITPPHESLSADMGLTKKEVKHEAHGAAAHDEHATEMPADTTHSADTTHVAAPAAEHAPDAHAPAHH